MLYNSDKVVYNTNNGNNGIIFGKRYVSFIQKSTLTSLSFQFTSDQQSDVIVYWGDGSDTTYLPPFDNDVFTKNYSNSNIYDVILEADYTQIKSLRFTNDHKIDLLNVLKLMPNIEILRIESTDNVNQNISNAVLPLKLKELYLQSNNIIANINTLTINDDLEYLNLTNNNISGSIVDFDFKNIKRFELRSNQVSFNDLSDLKVPDNFIELTIGVWVGGSISNKWVINNINDWDLSNTNLEILYLSGFSTIKGNMNNISLPYSLKVFRIIYNNNNSYGSLTYNLSTFDIENRTELTDVTFPNFTGNIDNLTLPNNLTSFNIRFSDIGGYFETVTIPNSLTYLDISELSPNFYFNISSYNFKNLETLYMNDNDNVTGDIENALLTESLNNIYAENCNISGTLDYNISNKNWINLKNNNITIDYDNVSFDGLIFLDLSDNNSIGDFENCSFLNINDLNIQNTNTFGEFIFSNFSNDSYDYLNLSNNDLYGNLTNLFDSNIFNTTSTSIDIYLNDNDFTGSVSDWDLHSNIRNFYIGDNNLSGSVSNWTLPSNWYAINLNNLSITGLSDFIDKIFNNRTVLSYNIARTIYISGIDEITNNPSLWVIEQGDLGSYAGDITQLDENSVNNLKNGDDYDGQGSNTPWTPGETIWWIQNAKQQSNPNIRRYFTLNVFI